MTLYHIRSTRKQNLFMCLSGNHKSLTFCFFFYDILNDGIQLFFSFITNCCVNLPTTKKLHTAELLSDDSKLYLQVCKEKALHIRVAVEMLNRWQLLAYEKDYAISISIARWLRKELEILCELVVLEVRVASTHPS